MEDIKSITQDGDVITEDGNLVFDPFNPENREITLNEVQSFLFFLFLFSKNIWCYRKGE
mgnify:CR=1 FL=1